MKKLFITTLCLGALCASGALLANNKREVKQVSATEFTEINSLSDFNDFKDALAADSIETNYKLMIDITYTPTESVSTHNTVYRGIFDGNGHTITINYNDPDTADMHLAFIRCLGNAGTIENLTIAGDIVTTGRSAGICLYNFGTIRNCVNRANISTKYNHLGGICAQTARDNNSNENTSHIINCVNYGNLSNESNHIGGIVGGTYKTTYIEGCKNFGTITKSKDSSSSTVARLGGIVGSTCDTTTYITNCDNYGTVKLVSGAKNDYGVGGIVGSNYSTSVTVIKNCYNSGDVYGRYVAGIMGYLTADQTGTTTVTNCLNAGAIHFTEGLTKSSNYYIAEIMGIGGRGSTLSGCVAIGSNSDHPSGASNCKRLVGNVASPSGATAVYDNASANLKDYIRLVRSHDCTNASSVATALGAISLTEAEEALLDSLYCYAVEGAQYEGKTYAANAELIMYYAQHGYNNSLFNIFSSNSIWYPAILIILGATIVSVIGATILLKKKRTNK